MASFICKCGKRLSNTSCPNNIEYHVYSDIGWDKILEKDVYNSWEIPDSEFDTWRCPICGRVYVFDQNNKVIKVYEESKEDLSQKNYRLYQVDSFTKEKFSGNSAGVVTNADGLTEEDMQKIARELNNSETAFIFSSQSEEYDVHVRFFTPRNEVPICGHATIAAHYVRALEEKFQDTRVVQKTGAGNLPVDILVEDDDYRVVMTQGKIQFGSYIQGENKVSLLGAMNLEESDLLAEHPIQIVSTGHSKVLIGIKNHEMLNKLMPNKEELIKLSEKIGCNGYYVYTTDSKEEGILIHGRMFAPAIGIDEDPVTGNANGPLGAYLVHHKLVEHNNESFRFRIKQGEAMGRAGSMEVMIMIKDGEPSQVKISGNAAVVFQTEISR